MRYCICTAARDVVLTGEWCGAVMADYFSSPASSSSSSSLLLPSYDGRGVQYHLGFHHSKTHCRHDDDSNEHDDNDDDDGHDYEYEYDDDDDDEL